MSEAESYKILVVDDETQITRVLKTALTARGYQVRTAPDGAQGIAAFQLWQPDLVITDLAMPEMTGVELCRELRKISVTPIIVLSVRDQDQSKVQALDAGADDYVTKPFSIQELEARVRSQLRRAAYLQPAEPQQQMILGDFVIHVPQHRIVVRGADVHLTPKQFDLLVYFAQHAGQVLTHRVLLRAIWGETAAGQPEYLRVAIGQLRKKIEDQDEPRYLRTEPWIGYRFCPSGNNC
jgi:two-component system KDP operon response regulator KdpE